MRGGSRRGFVDFDPKLKSALSRQERAIAEGASASTGYMRETDEARAKADELADAVKTVISFMALELPFLERPEVDLYARSYAEIMLNGETTLQLLDDYGSDLFFYVEERARLEKLLDEFRKEYSEGLEAEEAFHDAVAERRNAQEEAYQLIRRIKMAVRRFHGVDSDYYQALKDSRFKAVVRGKVETEDGGEG